MPIYAYICSVCNKEFINRCPLAEYSKTTTCPHCGSEGNRTYQPTAHFWKNTNNN